MPVESGVGMKAAGALVLALVLDPVPAAFAAAAADRTC